MASKPIHIRRAANARSAPAGAGVKRNRPPDASAVSSSTAQPAVVSQPVTR